MFEHVMVVVAYPVSLLVLILASVVVYISTRHAVALVQVVGFLLAFVGNLLVNFGPSTTRFAGSGDAIIDYTGLFSIGLFLGQAGMIIAALAFLRLAFQIGREQRRDAA